MSEPIRVRAATISLREISKSVKDEDYAFAFVNVEDLISQAKGLRSLVKNLTEEEARK